MPAAAAMLLPVEGTPHGGSYDVFHVIEAGEAAPEVVAIVPKEIRFRIEEDEAKLGLQYLFEPGAANFANLTASVEFKFDQQDVDEILIFVEKAIGKRPNVLSLASFVYTLDFVREDGTVVTAQNLTNGESGLSSPSAISLDVSALDRDALLELFAGTQTSGGLLADVHASLPIVAKSSDYADWKKVIDWARGKDILTEAELDLPSDPAIRALPEIRQQLATLLGASGPVRVGQGFAIGWDLAKAEGALDKQLESAKKASYRKLSEKYSQSAFLSFHEVCGLHAEKILNIATSEKGCGGLEQ